MSEPSSLSKKFTIHLDQQSATRLEWMEMFLKEIGVKNPKQREIVARAIDYYQDYLEELVVSYSMTPNAKDVRNEAYEVMQLSTMRPSAWNSLEMPKLDLASFGAFPKHSTLSRQYHNPIPRLPKVKKPKKASMSFADLKAKHHPPLPDHDFTQDQPMELTGDPESGKLLFNKSSN